MSDYIKREDAIRQIVKTSAQNELDIPAIGTVIYILSEMDSADVRENVRGEWLSKNLDNFRKYEVICSVCGARFIGNYDAYDEPYDFNFCPNCGAEMRGEQDG